MTDARKIQELKARRRHVDGVEWNVIPYDHFRSSRHSRALTCASPIALKNDILDRDDSACNRNRLFEKGQ
jgi:hypothetical protein